METQLASKSDDKNIKPNFKDSKYATGRRKKSIARVWLKKGSGNIYVNEKKMSDYFKKQNLQISILRPLTIVKRQMNLMLDVQLKEGGYQDKLAQLFTV